MAGLKQLSGQDATFLYLDTDRASTGGTMIYIYDQSTVPAGKLRFKQILEHIESRINTSPMFRQKLKQVPLALDYPYWVTDEDFRVENHVSHVALPKPGDWRQFCILASRLTRPHFDMNRPLWEMYVVEGLDNCKSLPRGCYAIATKIHHAAVDGASLNRFFSAMGDIDNKGTAAVRLETVDTAASPRPGWATMARRATINNLRSPLRLSGALMRAAPGLYQAAKNARNARDQEKHSVPETRFNGTVSPHKMFDATDFALDDFKAVRPAVPGCTINDVVLAVCGGALRTYLQHHGELPEAPLVAWVPINARAGGAADTKGTGNDISAMTTAIFTDVEAPLEWLRQVMESTRKSKEAKAGLSARLMTDLTKHVPATTQVMAARLVLQTGIASRACNLFAKNSVCQWGTARSCSMR